MAQVAIIGAGAMGLAAAYHALKDGHDVTVYEGDKVAGGMAAHFDFDGLVDRALLSLRLQGRPADSST